VASLFVSMSSAPALLFEMRLPGGASFWNGRLCFDESRQWFGDNVSCFRWTANVSANSLVLFELRLPGGVGFWNDESRQWFGDNVSCFRWTANVSANSLVLFELRLPGGVGFWNSRLCFDESRQCFGDDVSCFRCTENVSARLDVQIWGNWFDGSARNCRRFSLCLGGGGGDPIGPGGDRCSLACTPACVLCFAHRFFFRTPRPLVRCL
jgi:hypothetical protein